LFKGVFEPSSIFLPSLKLNSYDCYAGCLNILRLSFLWDYILKNDCGEKSDLYDKSPNDESELCLDYESFFE